MKSESPQKTLAKNTPSRISLEVESEFRASHTLAGFEIPHFHLWKVTTQFSAALPLKEDRLIDLAYLQTVMAEILHPLQGVYLNDAFSFSPTSENMALHIWEKIASGLPDAPLSEVRVTLCDLEGTSTGTARVSK
jgi:6-pyruvoyl-tetrahydropterin synthase